MRHHPHAELLRKGYEAFAKRDIETIRGLLADDIVWHVPSSSPVGGTHRGREAVLDAFRRLTQMTGDTFQVEVLQVVARGEHAVALTRLTSDAAAGRLDAIGAGVYRIREGRIREIWSLWPERQASNRFPIRETSSLQPSL